MDFLLYVIEIVSLVSLGMNIRPNGRIFIAGSSSGRTSLSESENLGSTPSPAANTMVSQIG